MTLYFVYSLQSVAWCTEGTVYNTLHMCMHVHMYSAVDSGQYTVQVHVPEQTPATSKCSYSMYMHVQTLKITSTMSCNMWAQVANPRYATVQLMIYALSQAAQDKN